MVLSSPHFFNDHFEIVKNFPVNHLNYQIYLTKKHRARSGVFCSASRLFGRVFDAQYLWNKWKDQWIKLSNEVERIPSILPSINILTTLKV
jgi:hypothetical protein